MANSSESIAALARSTMQWATSKVQDWTSYLTTAARLYKYPFHEQILIQAQRPGAVACAPMESWNRLGRKVNRGSHGIALPTDEGYLKYVFDIADTHPVGDAKPPYIWQMRESFEGAVSQALITAFDPVPKDCEGFPYLLQDIVDNVTWSSLLKPIMEFVEVRKGSLMEELEEDAAAVFFRQTVASSAAWCVLARCGLQPASYLEPQDFAHVAECNTYATATCLGNATVEVSALVLREIERTVKRCEKEYRQNWAKPLAQTAELSYSERKHRSATGAERQDDHGAKLSAGGGLSAPQSGDSEVHRDIRQVRDAAEDLYEGESAGDVQRTHDGMRSGELSGRDRPIGAGAGGGNRAGAGVGGGRGRGTEGSGYVGLGETDERPKAPSGGNRSGRAYIQIELDTGAEAGEIISPAFFASTGGTREVLEAKELPATIQETPAGQEFPSQFRITDPHLGEGGPKAKFAANAAAIGTLKQLEAEMRPATPQEKNILSRYVGWGGLSEAFDGRKDTWRREYALLQTLLTKAEYQSARASVLNAYYTSPTVIGAIYQAIGAMGFREGRILEPALGVGNFFGLLPEELSGFQLHGAELDAVTGRIAQTLYPTAHIQVKGYEQTDWPDNYFDLAVGNVPFGAYGVSDPRYDMLGFHIHDYFFAKTIDQVRPGGVIAFITSHYTMDKKDREVRAYIARQCELLGAIRLPNNAFQSNAGTQVTADIIFLQKRTEPVEQLPVWVQLGRTAQGLTVNQYFIDHPYMVLGELAREHSLYGSEDLVCKPISGADLKEQLTQAVSHMQAYIPAAQVAVLPRQEDMPPVIAAPPDMRNFSFALMEGQLYFRADEQLLPVETSKMGEERIRGMIPLRDTVRQLIDAQMNGCEDDALHQLQRQLHTDYDRYTAQYGLLNSRGNSMAFSDDASYPLLCALEVLNEDGNLRSKADLFTKRTIRQWSPVTRVNTAVEALGVSIGERARVDLTYMSNLLGCPGEVEPMCQELRGVIFRDPAAGEDPLSGWQTADEYLSGNVRHKLAVARQCAQQEPGRYEDNVEALMAAQPRDLEPSEIGIRLGAIWVPPTDYRQFVFELLDTPEVYRKKINVVYAQINGSWNISGKQEDLSDGIKANVTYGTKRLNAYEIIQDSLNLKDVKIFDYITEDGKDKAVLNRQDTMLAQQKQEAIRQAFGDWVWKDPARRVRLASYYNEHFNDIQPRQYNGSHIKFVGMNPEIQLRKHQRDAVARILYGENTLLAHVVGAGKTWTMAAAAMEGKRLGLCHKSLFVVPSHLTSQWGAEFLQLYPAANLLVATRKDFETHNRKTFCGRIATGDYDAIVIGHSQFEKIPVSLERQTTQLERQIAEIAQGIIQRKEENGEHYTIKQMEYTRKSLEERLKKLTATSRKDDVITFEELGIDRLFVDEAHCFKNLFLFTKMRNVAGVSQTEAQKSSDLYMKCQYMDEQTAQYPGGPGRGTIFATGTPISNSMSELYTMERYLQSQMLERTGLSLFDSWASTFGETVSSVELAPEGTGYRQKTRFARFYNLPELMNHWKEAADVQTADLLGLPTPKVTFHTVAVPSTALQRELVARLGERAEVVRRGDIDPADDNLLKITNDGRNLALDQRQIDSGFPDAPSSKVNACVAHIHRIWVETMAQRSTQMVFSDLSTPKAQGHGGTRAFSVYHDIKEKLLAHGVPEEEIAFIHSAKTEVQKAMLFSRVRAGQVRVLLGSTAKLGAGTNVQTKLIALHHLDVPWRPSDIEQRNGRILRQGNQNPEVQIFQYVTEGTFDSYSWQLIEMKQRFIGQVMTSKCPARTCEDVDTTALSYAEIKALAAGDPQIKERMNLEVEVTRLRVLRAGYQNEHYRLEDAVLQEYPRQIAQLEREIEGYAVDAITLEANTPADSEAFSMTLCGHTYTDKAMAGKALLLVLSTTEGVRPVPIGTHRGFEMEVYQQCNFLGVSTGAYGLTLKGRGPCVYNVELGQSVHGNLIRIGNALEELPTLLTRRREQLAQLHQQMETGRQALTRPWPREAEWQEKTTRLAELTIAMNAEHRQSEADEPEALDEPEFER